jgi:hypothetical protein
VYTWSDEWSSEGGIDEEIAECIGVPASKRCLLISNKVESDIRSQGDLRPGISDGRLTGKGLSYWIKTSFAAHLRFKMILEYFPTSPAGAHTVISHICIVPYTYAYGTNSPECVDDC